MKKRKKYKKQNVNNIKNRNFYPIVYKYSLLNLKYYLGIFWIWILFIPFILLFDKSTPITEIFVATIISTILTFLFVFNNLAFGLKKIVINKKSFEIERGSSLNRVIEKDRIVNVSFISPVKTPNTWFVIHLDCGKKYTFSDFGLNDSNASDLYMNLLDYSLVSTTHIENLEKESEKYIKKIESESLLEQEKRIKKLESFK